TAPAGTWTVTLVAVAELGGVTVTLLPPMPVNVTVSWDAVVLKPVPLMLISVPRRALGGLMLVGVGTAGGGGGWLRGPRPTTTIVVGSASVTIAPLVDMPPSGLVTVTVRAVSAASTATTTSSTISWGELKLTPVTVMPVPLVDAAIFGGDWVGGWKLEPTSRSDCRRPVRRAGVGKTLVMVGAEVIVRPLDRVTEPPPGLLTMTSSGPSVALPVTSTLMVICELLLTVMLTTEISVAVTPPRWKLTV